MSDAAALSDYIRDYRQRLNVRLSSVQDALSHISTSDCAKGIIANRKEAMKLYDAAIADLIELVSVLPADSCLYQDGFWNDFCIAREIIPEEDGAKEAFFIGSLWFTMVWNPAPRICRVIMNGDGNSGIDFGELPCSQGNREQLLTKEEVETFEDLHISIYECLRAYERSVKELKYAEELANTVGRLRNQLLEALDSAIHSFDALAEKLGRLNAPRQLIDRKPTKHCFPPVVSAFTHTF